MVYYRKYRPQTISELDLTSVRDKLTSILSSKALPHALLFTGPKGLGKTSSARIFAKAVNCERNDLGSSILDIGNIKKKPTSNIQHPTSRFEPCNKCEACISITNGSNIDVLEIDAASNGGVEEIRTLRERVKFAPSSLNYKVYIIDEVHMLSVGAFNALLKTLEEPPSHVIFILATTELAKVPSTVVSRTFQVEFQKPTNEEIVKSLERIVKGEKLQVKKEVLQKLAEVSDFSFRDAAKNLEELYFASNGGEINEELFETIFRTKGMSDQIFSLLNAYSQKDAKKSLEIISKLSSNGADFKIVIEKLVDYLRGLLMIRNGIESDVKNIPDFSLTDIKSLLELSNEAYAELGYSIIPSLPLELMSVKFCIIDQNLESGIQNLEKKEESLEFKGQSSRENENRKESSRLKGQSSEAIENNKQDILKNLIEKLNKTNKPAAALLKSCKSAEVVGSKVIITTPFPIHADKLKSEKVFLDLVKVVEEIVGKKVEVVIKVLPN